MTQFAQNGTSAFEDRTGRVPGVPEEPAQDAHGRAVRPKPPPSYVLRVIKGPDMGKSLVLDWSRTAKAVVGHAPSCELRITDARVARRHLSLSPEENCNALRLVDGRSSEGTRVGGIRVVEALLEGGETIELGGTTLRLMRAGELQAGAVEGDRFGRVLGQSNAMRKLFTACEALSVSMLPVILEGETGTGKDALAEAIHDASTRAWGPLVFFDCAAHDETTEIEALFGSPQGAGALERAVGGTLVIDEIGQLGGEAQRRLTASLERGEIWRAGENVPVRADVRVIATTRSDLDLLVTARAFREELLFRLAGARIQVPPLRQRHGDVELLARHFWRTSGGEGELPKHFLIRLARHDWPGNVHELEHAISRATTLGQDDNLEFHLGERTRPIDFIEYLITQGLPMRRARQLLIREFEKRFVDRAVRDHNGNVSRAAMASGMTRRYFHMIMAKDRR
ncbi:sigma 54-interacting transcriptional regulator [Pendulispora brunnea]|uniref:Sigma 54-interacting transcriptional regulator n=1 Tax=Pendulispora brunnea TaxID=2905690 RepID=A0ABZ2KCL8_9BACT